jgi:hypothetical protein
VVEDVVEVVSVEVGAMALLMTTEVGDRPQVAGLAAPVGGVTTQESVTVPVKEFEGVTVMSEVPVVPGTTEMSPLLERL